MCLYMCWGGGGASAGTRREGKGDAMNGGKGMGKAQRLMANDFQPLTSSFSVQKS